MSFLSAKAASISRVIASGCPPFASCIVHILISYSIAHNSCVVSCMCRSTLSEFAIGLSCSGGVLRGTLVTELNGRYMFGSVPGVNHPLWYRVGLDRPTSCVWVVCVNFFWRVGRVLNIPVHQDSAICTRKDFGCSLCSLDVEL